MLEKTGIALFIFFALKGIAWIVVAVLVYRGIISKERMKQLKLKYRMSVRRFFSNFLKS